MDFDVMTGGGMVLVLDIWVLWMVEGAGAGVFRGVVGVHWGLVL